MTRTVFRSMLSLALAGALAASTGCSSNETEPTDHGHEDPASARLFDVATDTELTPDVVLPVGVTTRVEVRFYAEDGDEITGIETTHFTSLTFTPAAMATVEPVAGARFQRDVTMAGPAGSTGTLEIGYGHDTAADEMTFGPFPVQAE